MKLYKKLKEANERVQELEEALRMVRAKLVVAHSKSFNNLNDIDSYCERVQDRKWMKQVKSQK